MKKKREIPYKFVLDELAELHIETKPMFGCEGIYVGQKIVLILREKEDDKKDNGIWVATFPEHHESLAADLPGLRSIEIFGPGPTAWQNIPRDHENFEENAFKVCELIRKKDPRIGKIPKSKKPKKNKTSKIRTPAKKTR